MTSFPALARRVRDESLDPRHRRGHLRSCLHRFAPYGFRATWHHLESTHRFPGRAESAAPALVRALDELERARAVVLPRAAAFAELRRRQKWLGRRRPAAPHPWDSLGGNALAYCPDPQLHPGEPLDVVVARVLRAYAAGADPGGACLVCGDEGRRPRRACRICGVLPGGRGLPD